MTDEELYDALLAREPIVTEVLAAFPRWTSRTEIPRPPYDRGEAKFFRAVLLHAWCDQVHQMAGVDLLVVR